MIEVRHFFGSDGKKLDGESFAEFLETILREQCIAMAELRYPTRAHSRLGRNRQSSHHIDVSVKSDLVETLSAPKYKVLEHFSQK